LSADDATRVLWDDPDGGVVLGAPDGTGAIAAVTRGAFGFVRLLAVDPAVRRRGHGRALLAAATAWLADAGATEVYTGGEAPFYLWPGVDVQSAAALSFFEASGYARLGAEMNMTCSAEHRVDPPAGITVARVGDGGPVLSFVETHWANWIAEAERAIAQGTCFAATDQAGDVVGFIGHSVNRAGWLGPMGTDPTRRHGGVGTALVAAVCADARAAGRATVEIAWVGPVGFYVKAVGAVVTRTFIRMRSRISR
jgi:GNAT superfamily N-acetyltransferase